VTRLLALHDALQSAFCQSVPCAKHVQGAQTACIQHCGGAAGANRLQGSARLLPACAVHDCHATEER